MHLSYSTSKYKGKVYKSYSIAESYRDGNKVKKRTICPIGKLTDEQAEKIRYICKIAKGNNQLVAQIKDVVVKDTRAYLDLAVVNEIWNRWQFDDAFDFDITASEMPTPLIAKILTMNRCTCPCSHYAIPAWAEKTALAEVLGVDLGGLNDDKIYYELKKIHKNKISIENHLFKQTYRRNPDSYGFINYDLSTSYFVGYKCNLSAFGKGKIECHGRRQVLLGVLINDQGYPFKWDVFPGNTAEVKTLEQNINACKTRYKLSGRNVTLVFDRGIISEDNGALIDTANMKYISALDRNQIPSCGVALTPFARLSYEKETDKSPLPKGFKKFDDDLYFLDCGIIGAKRLIAGFNPSLFREDRRNRDEKMDFFKMFLQKENKHLKKAKRDRSLEATKNRIVQKLTRLKIKKYYEPPTLHPIAVRKTLKNGVVKSVKSFQVKINKKVDVIKNDKLLDGVCVFVTNHTEHHGRGFKVKPQAIIGAYRDKTKIEDVFKNVKSFLKLRPFFVNTDAHVKAVYTVCILAYFINKYLANQRKALGEKDYLNSKELFGPFKDIDIATIEDSQTGQTVKKAVNLPENTQRLLKNLNMDHIVYSQEN
jgi:transposase